MIDSKQFQNTIDRFIELYGDRTEGIGDEIHAGLAWIDATKFVLIGGGDTITLHPPSWRRISRLFNLAQQLNRPLLLWDVPFQAEITGQTTTLLHKSAAQNSQLHLLKLPVPIIGVFDTFPFELSFTVVDAAVILQQGEAAPQPKPSEDETAPNFSQGYCGSVPSQIRYSGAVQPPVRPAGRKVGESAIGGRPPSRWRLISVQT